LQVFVGVVVALEGAKIGIVPSFPAASF